MRSKMNGNLTIKTSDLYFAAYLQCINCKIIKTDKEGTKTIFSFEDDQNRTNIKELYFNESKDSAVPALKYANAIRSLKTMCYIKN
jgi:hypothetical protein